VQLVGHPRVVGQRPQILRRREDLIFPTKNVRAAVRFSFAASRTLRG
jgi:hypothetical protein